MKNPMTPLHSDLMNLRCIVPDELSPSEALAFKLGQKQARHAAAELALANEAQWEAAVAAAVAAERNKWIASQRNLGAVGSILRTGKSSLGRPWHTLLLNEALFDLPEGTPLFTSAQAATSASLAALAVAQA